MRRKKDEREKEEENFQNFHRKVSVEDKVARGKSQKKHEAKSESEQMLNSSHSTHENWIGKLLFVTRERKKKKNGNFLLKNYCYT